MHRTSPSVAPTPFAATHALEPTGGQGASSPLWGMGGPRPPSRSSRLAFAFLLFGLGLLSEGCDCGKSAICIGRYSSATENPDQAPCSVPCDCNNQRYTGRCVDGICQSLPRGRCQIPGQTQACSTPVDGLPGCPQGRQICRPPGLSSVVWGDCLAASVPEDTRETCNDGLDNDCDGKIDAADPDCSVFCNPGQSRPCFDAPAERQGVGICKAGRQDCLPNGRWGICQGASLPGPEVCNGQDDDCDGRVDEGDTCACTSPAVRPCYTAHPSSVGQGACKAGLQTCEPSGRWGSCQGQILPTEEVCNGKDDDCDGAIDNGLQLCLCLPGQTRPCVQGTPYPPQGACRFGSQICEPSGTWGSCQGATPPSPEVCNGQDDDCDGLVDNLPPEAIAQGKRCECWPPGTSQLCFDDPAQALNRGNCRPGLSLCQAVSEGTLWGPCTGQSKPSSEICNRQDDDCDGRVDEGDTCQCVVETSRPCYNGPSPTQGVGLCKAGIQICQPSGTWGSCQGEIKPAPEICNEQDDDCNGLVDDGITCTACTPGTSQACYSGPPSTQGVGLCKAGSQICQASGRWGPCQGEIKPTTEVCNGKDDDCDGLIDNNVSSRFCYSGPPNTEGRGDCKSGSQICQNGQWGPCVGEILPKAEICDGKDNDCDGLIDNGLGTLPLERHFFSGTSGCVLQADQTYRCTLPCQTCKQICLQGTWQPCQNPEILPKAETCNNRDDDCNGQIDDNLTEACYDGSSGCTSLPDGSYLCKGRCKTGLLLCQNGSRIGCQGDIHPIPEICNGQDDDCDGLTDNQPSLANPLERPCFPGSSGCTSNPDGSFSCQGECKAGRQFCSQGSWGSCTQAVAPQPEVCDGKDNDCDGSVDEAPECSCTNEGDAEACYPGPSGTQGVGQCSPGVRTCNGGQWSACFGATTPTAEVCDGIDNDCDGQVDEGIPPLPCYTGPFGTENRGICRSGVEVCNNGVPSCQGQVTPENEICDGLDNNCDGAIDNQPFLSLPLTRPCYTGPPGTENIGPCKAGTQSCHLGQWLPCRYQILPQKESCNGRDDDCNGQVDDGGVCACTTPGTSETCYSGPPSTQGVGQCKAGSRSCSSTWSACNNQILPSGDEECDGIDNDCNGQIDDHVLPLPCYSPHLHPCKGGFRICQNGQWGPSCQGEILPQIETCDGLDNNCDGSVDENLACTCTTGQTRSCYHGDPATSGRGLCKAGTQTCLSSGIWTACVGQITPVTEVCSNSQDDDCDGKIDEGCTP